VEEESDDGSLVVVLSDSSGSHSPPGPILVLSDNSRSPTQAGASGSAEEESNDGAGLLTTQWGRESDDVGHTLPRPRLVELPA